MLCCHSVTTGTSIAKALLYVGAEELLLWMNITRKCKLVSLCGLAQNCALHTHLFCRQWLLWIPCMKLSFSFQNRSLFIQSVVAQCLVELSTSRSTFRFSIQGLDGTVYILVRYKRIFYTKTSKAISVICGGAI